MKEKLEKLVERMPYGVAVWHVENDEPGNIKLVFANERCADHSGVDYKPMVGQTMGESFPDWKGHDYPQALIRVADSENEETIRDIPYRGKSYHEGFFNATLVPLGDRHVASLYENVSVQRRLETRLKQMALEDPLTGLVNLRGFKKALRESLGRAERSGKMIALLFCDLDGFKAVNDMFGHDTGDLALKSVAEKLRKNIRQIDKVGRLGGDEFGIILEGIMREDDVEIIANKIIAAISNDQLYLGGRRKAQLGISIGVALAVYADEDLDLLLRHADAAMYRAKESGGNKYLFHNGSSSIG